MYLESLAIFARYADYIYIESIIPAVQSPTCFICHFCTAAARRGMPSFPLFPDGAGSDIANLTITARLLSETRAHYHICLFGYNLFNGPPRPADSPEQIPQSGPRATTL